jgi:3-hydroxyisobutyrate dehydrogenase-like beta-hydroxyacid dehydrogenase
MKTIGFIGLGNLGTPIATNLAKAGYAITVYNRTREKAEGLASLGARVADRPIGTLSSGGMVITLVSDDKALKEIATDDFAKALGAGGIHISMSTIAADTSRAMAEHHRQFGATYIAAPVFARPEAAAAKLGNVCISGGTAEERNRIKPVLHDAVAKGIFEFGNDAGAANVVKLIGNFIIASSLEMMSEAFTLAEKNGVDPKSVYEMITSTLLATPLFQNYGRIILAQQFDPAAFKLALGLKDVNLVLQNGNQTRTPMPLANLVHDRMVKAMANGKADLDWSCFAADVRGDAGLGH